MTLLQRIGLLLLFLAGTASAQGTLSLQLPECTEPGETQILTAHVDLEPGATLKSYDVRILFDPALVTFLPAQLTQGPWLQSGGPTFFVGDVIGTEMIVNAAILGPGLSVSGSGNLFSVPVTFLQPGAIDFAVSLSTMYDVTLQVLDVLVVPSAVEAPCTSFNLNISYGSGIVELSWDAQDLADAYRIYRKQFLGEAWSLVDSTAATSWQEAVTPESTRLYRVSAQYLP
ncbi:MAG: hypothetical protein KDC10_12980 [Calditrichaeota bacterium]|nr:hypothetical protein [Candidatus Cloacimonadota bacterium]MCB1048104.1 hypothetical protein [Calditrichota bacterium]MCB9472824.1 hypothetical protein [Candidatus Delongbacteria bacterium]